jgi:uncharacterized repeat protein (TIGR01451 family)
MIRSRQRQCRRKRTNFPTFFQEVIVFKTGFKYALLTGTAALCAWGSSAHAEGTGAGTSINNTASVTYSVGGNTQTASSNPSTFLVDRKANLLVTEIGTAATLTANGATDQVTTFRVTNLTNGTQDFLLTADQQDISIPLLGTDNFNVTNVRIFVDANGDGQYDSGDTATYIDELAADASITVFIVANVPNTAGQDVAIVSLAAQVAAGGATGTKGAALVPTLGVESPTAIDVVFADVASFGNLARDGYSIAFDSYKISTAAVSMTKTATVISDPLNDIVAPKAIPGAIVQYCLTISNAGPGIATNVAIADAIPAGTTYVSNSLTIGGLGVGGACVLNGTIEDDDQVGADETDLYSGYFANNVIHGTIPTLTTLLPLTAAFRVKID